MKDTDKFLNYGLLPGGADNSNMQQLLKDYLEAKLCESIGARDWKVDLIEYFNDQAGTRSPEVVGRDFSAVGEDLTEYWVDTQEGVRDKAISTIRIFMQWETNRTRSDYFGGISGGIANGFQIFWDRTFNFDGTPVVIRLFQTDPVRTNTELYAFLGIDNIHEKVTTTPNVTSLTGTYVFRNPVRLQNREGVGFVSDRLGVVLNDDFAVTAAELKTFQFEVNGDNLFLSRSII